jgi:CTP:molybdopterin cytidylyltransferase MocA
MDVLVGAGGLIDARDPLAAIFPARSSKALLPIAGRPMVQWVLDAVAASRLITRVFICGLRPEHDLRCGDKAVHYLDREAGIVESVLAGCRAIQDAAPTMDRALWVAGDLPLVRAEMLDWFAEQVQRVDYDFYFPVIEQHLMHRRFPGAARTTVRLKDRAVCIGDVYGGNTRAALDDVHPFWSGLTSIRKSPLRIAARVGAWPLLLFATRQMTTPMALRLARERFGLNATLVECPWAELGMDVDRPLHFDLVSKELAERRLAGPG